MPNSIAPGGKIGNGGHEGGDCGADVPQRLPQSVQSVPRVHDEYSDPEPPSSQSPSDAYEHVSAQHGAGGAGVTGGSGGGIGERGGGKEDTAGGGAAPAVGGADAVHRLPQSVQSVPRVHDA